MSPSCQGRVQTRLSTQVFSWCSRLPSKGSNKKKQKKKTHFCKKWLLWCLKAEWKLLPSALWPLPVKTVLTEHTTDTEGRRKSNNKKPCSCSPPKHNLQHKIVLNDSSLWHYVWICFRINHFPVWVFFFNLTMADMDKMWTLSIKSILLYCVFAYILFLKPPDLFLFVFTEPGSVRWR